MEYTNKEIAAYLERVQKPVAKKAKPLATGRKPFKAYIR